MIYATKPFSSAISEGSRSLDWYDKEVPKSTMTWYRALRVAVWAICICLTIYFIVHYNARQRKYTEEHQSVLTLSDGYVFRGVLIGYEGKNYVIIVEGNKELIDASLVRTIRTSQL